MLSGIAIIKTGYFGNINGYTSLNKIKMYYQNNMGVYHVVQLIIQWPIYSYTSHIRPIDLQLHPIMGLLGLI